MAKKNGEKFADGEKIIQGNGQDMNPIKRKRELTDTLNNQPPEYMANYIKYRGNKAKTEATDHGTFVSNTSCGNLEKGYGISKIVQEKKYISSVGDTSVGFLLTVGPLKRQSGDTWIDLEKHGSSVLCVNMDLDARNQYSSKLPLGGFNSYSHIKFCNIADAIAKDFCIKHGYSFEHAILGFPQTRWLVYKTEGGNSFFPKERINIKDRDKIKGISELENHNDTGKIYEIDA